LIQTAVVFVLSLLDRVRSFEQVSFVADSAARRACSDERPYPFLGCSKKACWACYHFMNNYTTWRGQKYQMRGCHGQSYARWHLGVLESFGMCRSKVSRCLRVLIRLIDRARRELSQYEREKTETPNSTPPQTPHALTFEALVWADGPSNANEGGMRSPIISSLILSRSTSLRTLWCTYSSRLDWKHR